LPTPPFWFAIATIRAEPGESGTTGSVCFFEPVRGSAMLEPVRADDEEAREEGLLTAGP